jgi:hypothetical protein
MEQIEVNVFVEVKIVVSRLERRVCGGKYLCKRVELGSVTQGRRTDSRFR